MALQLLLPRASLVSNARPGPGDRVKDVIVLGAGASLSLGYPLANDLFPRLFEYATVDELRPLREFVNDLYPRSKSERGWLPLAEDAFGMMSVARQYASIRGGHRGYKWKGDAVLHVELRFRRLLASYFWSLQAPINSMHALRRLVRKFNAQAVYVTFNYDLTLETALSHESIPYRYGLPIPSRGVSVLKPHGSINWFERSRYAGWQAPADVLPLGDNLVALAGLDPSVMRAVRVPFVVPPTPTKQFELPELKRIWTSFQSSVISAKRTLVIGYSLPDADRLARLVLMRGARAPRKRSKAHMALINPKRSVGVAFRQNVAPTLEHVQSKFEPWVRNLP